MTTLKTKTEEKKDRYKCFNNYIISSLHDSIRVLLNWSKYFDNHIVIHYASTWYRNERSTETTLRHLIRFFFLFYENKIIIETERVRNVNLCVKLISSAFLSFICHFAIDRRTVGRVDFRRVSRTSNSLEFVKPLLAVVGAGHILSHKRTSYVLVIRFPVLITRITSLNRRVHCT